MILYIAVKTVNCICLNSGQWKLLYLHDHKIHQTENQMLPHLDMLVQFKNGHLAIAQSEICTIYNCEIIIYFLC